MTRKTVTDHGKDADRDENLSPEEEQVRVRQTKESVQDAIAKLIGEPAAATPVTDRPVDHRPEDRKSGSGEHDPASPDFGTRDIKHSPIPETGKH